MSTIVSNIEDIRDHAVTNYNFSWETIAPVIKKMERKYIKALIGRELYVDFSESSGHSGSKEEVLELMKEASVNLALLSYSKIGMVSISDKGLTITSSQNTKTPEWWQVRDLRRELLDTAMGALDDALKTMEKNQSDFDDWKDSEGFTEFYEFFVRKTEDFNRHYNINHSRLTFLKLRPHLLKVEDKYFLSLLGSKTVKLIKDIEKEEEDGVKEALKIAKAAQVALTISEIAQEGGFVFSQDILKQSTDEIPGEKSINSEGELRRINLAYAQSGNEYLKKLVKHLKAYPETFEDFADRQNRETPNPVHNTRSIVSF